jgi:hypothetical protein
MTKRLTFYQKAMKKCWSQFEAVNKRRAKVEAKLKKEQELTDLEKINSGSNVDWPWLLNTNGQFTAKRQERKNQLAKLSGLNEYQFGSDGVWKKGQAAIKLGFRYNDPVRTKIIFQCIQTLLPFICLQEDKNKWFIINYHRKNSYEQFYLVIRERDGWAKINEGSYEWQVYRDWMPLMDALKICQQALYYEELYENRED